MCADEATVSDVCRIPIIGQIATVTLDLLPKLSYVLHTLNHEIDGQVAHNLLQYHDTFAHCPLQVVGTAGGSDTRRFPLQSDSDIGHE